MQSNHPDHNIHFWGTIRRPSKFKSVTPNSRKRDLNFRGVTLNFWTVTPNFPNVTRMRATKRARICATKRFAACGPRGRPVNVTRNFLLFCLGKSGKN